MSHNFSPPHGNFVFASSFQMRDLFTLQSDDAGVATMMRAWTNAPAEDGTKTVAAPAGPNYSLLRIVSSSMNGITPTWMMPSASERASP